MQKTFNMLIVLLFNYFFVTACNHVSASNKTLKPLLKSNSDLKCESLGEKVPRRFIKTVSIEGDTLFIYSQKSNSKMDASEFEINGLKFKRKNEFANANSIKEFEKGLLIETNDATVIMVGANNYYVDFPSDKIRYFQVFDDQLYVLIDQGQYVEIYKNDLTNKKSELLKRVSIDFNDVRFAFDKNTFSVVFLTEKNKQSSFVSYSIADKKASVARYKLQSSEVIDWDISSSKNKLSIYLIGARDYYSDKQDLIRIGIDLNSKKRLPVLSYSAEFKSYDSIKLNSDDSGTYTLLQSDKEDDRRVDFFETNSSLKALSSKKIPVKRAYLKQWKSVGVKSFYIFASVNPLGDKYYICQ